MGLVPKEVKESVRYSETGITEGCELPAVLVLGIEAATKAASTLNPEPSLQSLI